MGNFYENLNTGLEKAVPLAMKKYELDQANDKWNQQLKETKAQHLETMAAKHLDAFKTSGDPTYLKLYADLTQKARGFTPETTGMLPTAETQNKLETMAQEKGFQDFIASKMKPVTREELTGDVDPGLGMGLPEAQQTPIQTTNTPELTSAMLKEGLGRFPFAIKPAIPLAALTSKDELAAANYTNAVEKMKLLSDFNAKLLEIKARMADTAATRAERTGATKTGTWVYDGTTAEGFPMYHNSITGEPKVGDQKISAKPAAPGKESALDRLIKAKQGGGGGVTGMPDPSKYNGQSGTDTATGKRYKSNGTEWVEIK